jgi:hypothetical protein
MQNEHKHHCELELSNVVWLVLIGTANALVNTRLLTNTLQTRPLLLLFVTATTR